MARGLSTEKQSKGNFSFKPRKYSFSLRRNRPVATASGTGPLVPRKMAWLTRLLPVRYARLALPGVRKAFGVQ